MAHESRRPLAAPERLQAGNMLVYRPRPHYCHLLGESCDPVNALSDVQNCLLGPHCSSREDIFSCGDIFCPEYLKESDTLDVHLQDSGSRALIFDADCMYSQCK